ncbi:MAG: DUF401 family protein [Candidatus Cloacimonetes bacterium]|nr:DUF401 family protein [Candidatus Cloacimonadota bacterium]MCF7813394.1 DUF401 family protein [Candidatus Cloacimonadota bacterium]MCF7867481.1 DUF401 family protein [Candidatus Cloacimonadota bacterium]MCF7883016.1 DUF401 family protein [Candidatus Cloacimonadota bacterium]
MLIWISFLVALALIVIIARKSLWLALIIGAVVLGLFNLSLPKLGEEIVRTITQTDILLLAIAVGLIPMIGGSLQVSGLLRDLVDNLQLKRQVFLGLSPALMGILPIPGGALLSAPMLIRAGEDISDDHYAAINVWFRHILILIYPLGALLPASKMAGLNIYSIILFILPAFFLLFFLGYFFFLRSIKGDMPRPQKLNISKLLVPLIIILTAPIIHITLSNLGMMDEISLLIGISSSLILTAIIGKLNFTDFKTIFQKMRPWKYFLIIIGVFLFLHVFQASPVSEEISKIVFSKSFLIIFIGAFLSLATGRVQLPISILIPIYISTYGAAELTPLAFAIMYVAVYIGYMISPVHPCVSVSIEFYGAKYKDFAGKLLLPSLIGFGCSYIAALVLL